MQMKKNKGESGLFSTENEFKMLLQIHNEIKYITAQAFPFLNPKVIDNLFVILSSQALLYDQIIRKGINQQESIMKQSSIGKLLQNNKSNLEKNIIQHLNVLTTNFQTPLSQFKQEGFTIINSSRNNRSESIEDSSRVEQESIISKIKRKMKIDSTARHPRTNSVCLSSNVFKQEELKKLKVDTNNNNIKSNNNKHDNSIATTAITAKPLLPINSERKEQNTRRKMKLEKTKSTSNTQNRFETVKNPTQAPVINYQCLHTISAPNECESRNKKDKSNSTNKNNNNIVLNYKAFGEISVKENMKGKPTKPSNNAKNLTKKYYDIVNNYEKMNSDDEGPRPSIGNNISLHVSEKTTTNKNETIHQPKLLITIQNKLFTSENPQNAQKENAKKGNKDKRLSVSVKM